MKQEAKKQLKIYSGLVIVLATISAISVFMPIPSQFEALQQTLPTSKPVFALANFGLILFVYGLLGLLGYYLSRKLNWPGIFNRKGLYWEPCGINS